MFYNKHKDNTKEAAVKRYTVKSRIKKIKKRATASAVAGATALGILLGGTFNSPAELLEIEDLNSRTAITDMLIPESTDDDGADEDAAVVGEERKKNFRARFKERVMAMPYYVRAFVGLPLWCLGWLILSAAGLLWEPVLSPLMSGLVNVVCVAGIVLAALIATVKAAFPDMPIRKILRRQNLYTAFFGAVFFGAAGALMQIFLPEQKRLQDIAGGIILLCVLGLTAVPVLRHEAKRRREVIRIAEETKPGQDELFFAVNG